MTITINIDFFNFKKHYIKVLQPCLQTTLLKVYRTWKTSPFILENDTNCCFFVTLVCEKMFSVSINVSRLELIKANNQSFNDKNKSNNNNFDSSNTNSNDGKYNHKVLNGIHFSLWEGQTEVRATEVFAMITYPNKPIPWLFSSFHQAYRTPPPEPQDLCQRYRTKWLPPLPDRYPLLQCWLSFPVRRESLTHESLLIGEGLS